jgi:hypothetical protein
LFSIGFDFKHVSFFQIIFIRYLLKLFFRHTDINGLLDLYYLSRGPDRRRISNDYGH